MEFGLFVQAHVPKHEVEADPVNAEHSRLIGSIDGDVTRPVFSYEACSSRYASASSKVNAMAGRSGVSWRLGAAVSKRSCAVPTWG